MSYPACECFGALRAEEQLQVASRLDQYSGCFPATRALTSGLQESAPARTRSLCSLRALFRKPLELRAALLQALRLLVQQRLHKKSVLSHSWVDVLANSPNPPSTQIIQSHACGSSPLFGGMSLLARALRHAAAAEARCVARQGCTAPEAPALQRHVFWLCCTRPPAMGFVSSSLGKMVRRKSLITHLHSQGKPLT